MPCPSREPGADSPVHHDVHRRNASAIHPSPGNTKAIPADAFVNRLTRHTEALGGLHESHLASDNGNGSAIGFRTTVRRPAAVVVRCAARRTYARRAGQATHRGYLARTTIEPASPASSVTASRWSIVASYVTRMTASTPELLARSSPAVDQPNEATASSNDG